MFRTLLKSEIQCATVTPWELNHQGSCAIDENLLNFGRIAEAQVTGFMPRRVFVEPDKRSPDERSTLAVQMA